MLLIESSLSPFAGNEKLFESNSQRTTRAFFARAHVRNFFN